MHLKIVRGPLSDSELRPVADLYGRYRGKYSDLEFCRRMFNDNPFGYSLHAFLELEDGTIVGHYSIIPTDVLVDGQRRAAGKAEALIVDPGHRRATVRLEGGTTALCGLAMPARLYRYALDHGMEVIHMIPDPEVQGIYPITGSRPVGARHLRARLFVSPAGAVSPGAPPLRRAAQAVLSAGQQAAYSAASVVVAATSALGRRTWRRSGANLGPDLLARIEADVPRLAGWTLSIDAPTLRWVAHASHLELIALDQELTDYAVVCGRAGEGQVMEILFCRQRTRSLTSAVRLLDAVVRSARAMEDGVVGFSHTAAPVPSELARLRTASRLLFFQERLQDTNLFVATRHRYFLDPANLRFTPFFYGMF